jgi:hypothetical protein
MFRRANLIQLSQSNRTFHSSQRKGCRRSQKRVSVLLKMGLHNALWRSKERARRFRTWHRCLDELEKAPTRSDHGRPPRPKNTGDRRSTSQIT